MLELTSSCADALGVVVPMPTCENVLMVIQVSRIKNTRKLERLGFIMSVLVSLNYSFAHPRTPSMPGVYSRNNDSGSIRRR